ncbi:MAG: diphthine--ammonia ligase [Candidatus Omnitrophica bacterium]|nr:diphthine--ammonia ligase [Candidatus Omnitrophota bacterium]
MPESKIKMNLRKEKFFCSFSGGKDSCLALYKAIQQDAKPQYLLTMLDEVGKKSRSHRIPKNIIEQQAKSLKIPVIFRRASWDSYEEEFISGLGEIKQKGVAIGVFGDIDIQAHQDWVERVCRTCGIKAYQPLWQKNRQELLNEFIKLGFKAKIIVLKADKLNKSFLGRDIDYKTMADLGAAGVDPSGEEGEYHTIVTNGPIFSSEVLIKEAGRTNHEGYWFLEIT